MIATAALALALAATGSADPARTSPDTTALTGTITATAAQPTKARKPTQYCVRQAVTGSRIPRTFCQTREGWLIDGFDPLAQR